MEPKEFEEKTVRLKKLHKEMILLYDKIDEKREEAMKILKDFMK